MTTKFTQSEIKAAMQQVKYKIENPNKRTKKVWTRKEIKEAAETVKKKIEALDPATLGLQQPDNFKHDTGGFRISDYEANKAKQRLRDKGGMLSHKSSLKHSKKGRRIWIENPNFLNDSGFSVGTRYNVEPQVTESSYKLTLDDNGKRKVTATMRRGKPRPIIDIQNTKVGQVFDNSVNFVNAKYVGNGTIIISEAS